MIFTILTGRTAHVSFEYLSIVSRGGKPDRISDFCDTISTHQQWKTVLDPKRKQIIEYRHFHVFFKEPAAFAFADIYMVRNIVQTEIFHGMLLNVRHNTAETVQVF